jgi:hypothetical protein
MNLDDTDDYADDYLEEYGLFLDAQWILTKEEYFAKVLFREGILQSVENSEFKLDIPYEINKDGLVAFNFGDLLTHVSILERLKWKQFYKGIGTDVVKIDEAYKLLFFDIENTRELQTVKDYWKKRIENLDSEVSGDQPWFSARDREQTSQELHFLKQIDRRRDLASMNFKPQVLDKYKNSDLCDVGSDHISFLRHDKTPVSIASFIIRNNVLMMFAKEFYNVPPIERSHWISYQIQSEQGPE